MLYSSQDWAIPNLDFLYKDTAVFSDTPTSLSFKVNTVHLITVIDVNAQ